jgi:tetratricopeptide (TPR) repeat protein
MKALFALAIVAGLTATAAADPPSSTGDAKTLPFDAHKVQTLFDQGTKHYDLGEYDQAIASFRQAYALLPDPSFLFNIGQAFRQQHHCRDASAAYKAYLRHAPNDDRAKVEGFLRELEPCARTEEDQLSRMLPPPELTPLHKKLRWIGAGVAGAGALAIGTGIYFSVRALHTANELERKCGGVQPTCTTATALDLEGRGKDAQRNATRLYIAGGAVAGVGLGMLIYSVARPERQITVLPAAGGGAFVATGGTF